jgi:anti-sigma B factor antagonist
MPAPLQITQRSAAGVAVLELGGQLVADEGDAAFKAHVAALISAGCRHVLLDLGKVAYMDSGGAGVLAATYLHIVKRGGALKLLTPSERVYRVLQSTHLLAVFEVFDDEATAIRSFIAPAKPTPIDG